jgi:hypothetical protein
LKGFNSTVDILLDLGEVTGAVADDAGRQVGPF